MTYFHFKRASLALALLVTISLRTEAAPGGLVKCTAGGQTCISTASCVNQVCKCPAGTIGDGRIECVPKNHILCNVIRDPHTLTWDGSSSDVDTPCWYGITAFDTDTCSVRVEALNKLSESGHFFVEEVSVELQKISVVNGSPQRKTGSLEKYVVTRNDALNAYEGDNPWNQVTSSYGTPMRLNMTFDATNNFSILEAPDCGNVRIKYRAWISRQSPQINSPGVTVSAPKKAKFSHNTGEFVCRTPGEGPSAYSKRRKALNFDQVAFVPIYESFDTFVSLFQTPKCVKVKDEYKTCGARKVFATNLCGPIWTDHHIRLCLKNSGGTLESIYKECLAWACGGSSISCASYYGAVSKCSPTAKMTGVACDKKKLTAARGP